MKTEPETFSWEDLVRDTCTTWDGVRNFQARNNMRAMKKGDLVFLYHSGKEKAIRGVARVVREAYPDPTAKEGDWSVVDLVPEKRLSRAMTLQEIKQDPTLTEMVLVKNARLSVQPVTSQAYVQIMKHTGG